jgi:hypothetical protein
MRSLLPDSCNSVQMHGDAGLAPEFRSVRANWSSLSHLASRRPSNVPMSCRGPQAVQPPTRKATGVSVTIHVC